MTGTPTNADKKIAKGTGDAPGGHIPVMLEEVVQFLQPAPGKVIVDGTFGGGGYARAILSAGGRLVALDKDPDALILAGKFTQAYGSKFQFIGGEFGQMDVLLREAGISEVDGVVLDIGVSSMQLDQAERGFSFRRDGPLDMRMDKTGISAADVVNRAEGRDLTRIIGALGEERHAGRISRAIVARREEEPILRTLDLARIVEKVLGRKFNDKIHPATRTFQALRIFVNRELEQLARGLFAAERMLKSGGRLVVVTFHSLEDRIVKQFLNDRCGGRQNSRHMPQVEDIPPVFTRESRKAIKAGDAEITTNPRARSAKLRWAIRTSARARDEDMSLFGRPLSPSLTQLNFANTNIGRT